MDFDEICNIRGKFNYLTHSKTTDPLKVEKLPNQKSSRRVRGFNRVEECFNIFPIELGLNLKFFMK